MVEIVLPAGTKNVTVEEIPGLMALAIHPRVTTGLVVSSYLTKHSPLWPRGVPLDPADEALLSRIWKELPPWQPCIAKDDWPHYAKTFDAAPDRPEWVPLPVWRNDALGADMLRADAHEQHRRALSQAMARGELTPVNHALLPSAGFPADLVQLDAFARYAGNFNISVRVAEPNTSSERAHDPDEAPRLDDWKMRVQAEAAAHWLRLRDLGCNPTRASIRPHLLKWCKENNVLTSGKINPSDGYLRAHVLSGKHWTPPG